MRPLATLSAIPEKTKKPTAFATAASFDLPFRPSSPAAASAAMEEEGIVARV